MVSTGHIKVRYKCDMCQQSLTMNHYNKVVNILELGDSVSESYRCTFCGLGTMSVAHIFCMVTKDIYGDEKTGYWECKHCNHDTMKYYPLPIRGAHLKDDPGRAENWGVMADSYEKISRGGTPWKCPLCRHALKYSTERISTMVEVKI